MLKTIDQNLFTRANVLKVEAEMSTPITSCIILHGRSELPVLAVD